MLIADDLTVSIINLHRMHAVHKVQPIVTDVHAVCQAVNAAPLC